MSTHVSEVVVNEDSMLKLAMTAGSGSFISGLMAPRVPFIVTAFGKDVDPLCCTSNAAFAEQERRMILERASVGLQAAKGSRCAFAAPTLRGRSAPRGGLSLAAGRR